MKPNLWFRFSQTSNTASLFETWLIDTNYSDDEGEEPITPVDSVGPAKYILTAVSSNEAYGSVTGSGEYEAGETVTRRRPLPRATSSSNGAMK
ncbi:MAG: hypothetical protein NC324_05065 [Bacteroides sp.]|nr:hypothetical protein [Bacteroides sp.]